VISQLRFFGKSLLKLAQKSKKEIEVMNNQITSTEIEAVIKKSPQKTNAQPQISSQENSVKHLEKRYSPFAVMTKLMWNN